MTARKLFTCAGLSALLSLAASPALGLANRVFVSARSGNDANACDNVQTPCQTFAGAVPKLNPDGEVIVLDSGGYGPVTITQGISIDVPAGVTAFIHPPSGHAVTINAPGARVTLRGLVLNGGVSNGIEVQAVGWLNVVNGFISGFGNGIHMGAGGDLNVKNTDVTACGSGVLVDNSAGSARVSIDRCHLDANGFGFYVNTAAPGASTTMVTNTTTNDNLLDGWRYSFNTTGVNVLNLEFCVSSGNGGDGIFNNAAASSTMRYSNCVFANNGFFGVENNHGGVVETRGNNTMTGNGGATSGPIGSFTPQ